MPVCQIAQKNHLTYQTVCQVTRNSYFLNTQLSEFYIFQQIIVYPVVISQAGAVFLPTFTGNQFKVCELIKNLLITYQLEGFQFLFIFEAIEYINMGIIHQYHNWHFIQVPYSFE